MNKEEENKELKEINREEFDKIQKEKGLINMQTKVSIEVKLSRNYNTVTFGIQDEPIKSTTEKEFREELHKKAEVLRAEADKELKLFGSFPK